MKVRSFPLWREFLYLLVRSHDFHSLNSAISIVWRHFQAGAAIQKEEKKRVNFAIVVEVGRQVQDTNVLSTCLDCITLWKMEKKNSPQVA